MVGLVPLGLVCRFVPIGLPGWAVKYGGSSFWAAMVYWLMAMLLPGVRSGWTGVVAAMVSAGVEFFKLVQTPGLDAFRDTIAGKLLLGRYFGWMDIAVYWIAVGISVWIDWMARNRRGAMRVSIGGNGIYRKKLSKDR
jgi:hypothetical protein